MTDLEACPAFLDASSQQWPAADILVVEDDPDLRATVSEYLEDEGLSVTGASTCREALNQIQRSNVSLILLDLRLGSENGLDFLRDVRRGSDVPVIVMTGHRREEIDRIIGLELGADDYITKPFSFRELLARINAVLRRFEAAPVLRDKTETSPRTYHFAGWTLDRRLRRLTDPAGVLVPLTKGEFALLSSFLDAPQRPLTREFLLQATRIHEDIFDRSIDVQILRLRRKLEVDPSAPTMIVTERGVGYRFAIPVAHVRQRPGNATEVVQILR